MATATDPTTELPGMPARPELRTKNGRIIENGHVSVKGGVSFDLRNQAAIDYLADFNVGDEVTLVVHGRVADNGDRSKITKDGDSVVRHAVVAIDFIEGAPNDEAQQALAENPPSE